MNKYIISSLVAFLVLGNAVVNAQPCSTVFDVSHKNI